MIMQTAAPAAAADIVDVYLSAGQFHFGGGRTRIRTVLGTCVAITLWHPGRRIGGMCHYMLPERGAGHRSGIADEGLYADEAFALFERDLVASCTRPADYVVKIFGGGNMFEGRTPQAACGKAPAARGTDGCMPQLLRRCHDIACKNLHVAHELLTAHDFRLGAANVGGFGSRQIAFELWSGDVWVRRSPPLQCGQKSEG
jgi:chemotaxis protein CheD